MRWSSDARRGFVLMEAVIALAIISIMAVALLGATAAQVRTADKGGLLLVAQALAEERMATVRSLGWEQLRSLPDSIAEGVFPPPFHEYAWRAEVAQVDDEHELFSVGIQVMVADESFAMSSLVHEPEVSPLESAGGGNPFSTTPPPPPPPPGPGGAR